VLRPPAANANDVFQYLIQYTEITKCLPTFSACKVTFEDKKSMLRHLADTVGPHNRTIIKCYHNATEYGDDTSLTVPGEGNGDGVHSEVDDITNAHSSSCSSSVVRSGLKDTVYLVLFDLNVALGTAVKVIDPHTEAAKLSHFAANWAVIVNCDPHAETLLIADPSAMTTTRLWTVSLDQLWRGMTAMGATTVVLASKEAEL